MSKDMRNLMNNFGLLTESFNQFSTSEKLRRTAVRDGHITKNETTAQYIMDAAREVADKWDKLDNEEKKVFRNTFYQVFLKKIGKIESVDLNF